MNRKKKAVSAVLSAAFVLSFAVCGTAEAYYSNQYANPLFMEDFGDINGDGAVDTDDLLAAAGIFLGSAPENPAEGTDFDCNGIVTVADYCRLKNYLLEKQIPSVRYNWDISVSGNGFLQLMDADGKTIYAESAFVKAEADGSLTDENDNCLLGVSGDTSAEPGSGKIKISVPYLEPAKAEATETFNGTEYTLTAEKCTSKGNVFFDFTDSYSLPEGTKAVADITGGCIKITLNSEEYFKNTEELTDCINSAITEALDGEEHPAGRFTLTASDESEFESSESGLSGSEITGSVSVLGIKSFVLHGGMKGGEQTVSDVYEIIIEPDGTINGIHDVYGMIELGRIDLAVFKNPSALKKNGSYFEETPDSGKASVKNAGKNGAGKIKIPDYE